MSLITDANDTIRRLEARVALWQRVARELFRGRAEAREYETAALKAGKAFLAERDNAARNERIRIADRAEALAVWNSEHPGYTAEHALAALAAELRAEGGGR